MTHRDRAGDPSGQRAGRREAAGPAGHRQGFPTPSGGSPARPKRRFSKVFGRPMALRWGAWLPMSRIATPRAPGRKPWETVSMGHYQRSLVLRRRGREVPKPRGYRSTLKMASETVTLGQILDWDHDKPSHARRASSRPSPHTRLAQGRRRAGGHRSSA